MHRLFSKIEILHTSGIKGSQLDVFCPKAIVYCYLEFKLSYLKDLKLFSSKVKELFELIVLKKQNKTKQNKNDRFCSF